eukprot:CAMPEP_0196582230 /NCGR_PEP_ID=MMETSP1081-20130531/38112_1 /TAXON_ID=36882 /ORGANISM="Pyramimonas amylifera, Strain CCMP720" /LENGTH=193 /DNA_ID=CAMNT_0041902733 /DNA_START=126 /DNA_END=704 /DNA_ORIENTATION=+
MVTNDSESPVNRELFGGAVAVEVAKRFVDVSDFRQVPDNQECFADGNADESLLVELLEHKSDVRDEDSARFFFDDLGVANEASACELTHLEIIPLDGTPRMQRRGVSYLVTGRQQVAKGKDDADAANVVLVHLVVIRLPDVATDILITINKPIVINPNSCVAGIVDINSPLITSNDSVKLLRHALRTLEIKDW